MNKTVIFKHRIEDIDFINEYDVLGRCFRFINESTFKYTVIIYGKLYDVHKNYLYTNNELRKIKLQKICIK